MDNIEVYFCSLCLMYSFSQIQVFQSCPRKYQFQYLERLKRPKSGKSTRSLLLGTSVHESLEWWYQQIFAGNDSLLGSVAPDKEELVSLFNYQREKNLKSAPEIGDDSAENEIYRQRGERYVRQYWDLFHQSDFSLFSHIEEEKAIVFTFPEGQEFKVKIDRIDYLKNGDMMIVDYKTGKNLPLMKEESYIEQLKIYTYAMQGVYPGKKITASLAFLHFGIEDQRQFSDEEIQTVIQKYQQDIKKIEYFRNLFYTKKQDFPLASDKTSCSYCEFYHDCPLYKQKLSSEDSQHLKTLVDRYAEIVSRISLLDMKVKDSRDALLSHLITHQVQSMQIGPYQVSYYTQMRKNLQEKEQLLALLKEKKKSELLQVSDAILKEKIEQGEIEFSEIEEWISQNETVALYVSSLKEENSEE